MKTMIVVDSCCDLPLSFVEENIKYIDVIGMPVNIGGFEYFDDLGKTFTHNEFYSKLREGIIPSTAQINSYRFSEIFEKHIKEGKSIVYIGFSSELSGTFNNAVQAVDIVKENYADADIKVVDTMSASLGQGLLVVKALEMLKNNESGEAIAEWLEQNKMKLNHWFAVDDLMYLKKGGRISQTQATVGTILNVKPILIVDKIGKLKTYSKVKGRKKSMKFLVEKFKEHYDESKFQKIVIGHGNVPDDAETLKQMLLKEIEEENIIISELSATIASHVGPGMLAVAFLGNQREQ